MGVLILTGLVSCIPTEKQPTRQIRLGWEDPVVRTILGQQDRRQLDSLYAWLDHEDPTYRYYAVEALASVGDSTSVPRLEPVLQDPNPEIRLKAIYALGQIRSESATLPLLAAFDPWDSLGRSAVFNAAILEAVGKAGSPEHLLSMASVKTYEQEDSLYLIGQARGIFHFALRGLSDPQATARMAAMLASEQTPREARFFAGHALARAPDIRLDTLILEMVNALRTDPDPQFRMVLALAIGRSQSDLARSSLIGLFPLEKDYRVRCNMLRGLARQDYLTIRETLEKALQDSSALVGIVAAEVLGQVADPKDSPDWLTLTRSIREPWVRAHLYQTLSRLCPVYLPATRTALQNDIRQAMNTQSDPYLRGVYIRALGKFGWNVPLLREEWTRSRNPYIRTTAMEALKDISDRPDFQVIFGESARSIRRNLGDFFAQALESRDAGSVAVAALALRNPGSGYRDFMRPDSSFQKALENCILPQEIETYNEVAATRAFFRRGQFTPSPVPFNHPLEWDRVAAVKENTRVVIKTSRGNIILQLWPDRAPGTVANFLQLVESKFYDGKVFHRVVPNFVIQGGCPRGDGYGSLNYTIRSELGWSRFEREGLLGMASAGLHTEGVQFFITHSAAPHLNGRYTCFGEVETGMDVVHLIRPGDRIESAEIVY